MIRKKLTDHKVRTYLAEYAHVLREGVNITNDLPLMCSINMASGLIAIKTADGRCVGTICVEKDIEKPYMPIGPATMTYAQLFVALINGVGGFYQEKNGCYTPGTSQ
jgi:uncharacterized protein YejL (UPF0352 family)